MEVPRILRYDMSSGTEGRAEWQMHFVRCDGKLTAKYNQIKTKQLKPDEVMIAVKSLAVNENSSDSVIAYAGVVEHVGSAAVAFNLGDAVMGIQRTPLASLIVCNVHAVQGKPSALSWSEAAGSMLSYCTVYNALTAQANIRSGDTVLIHPARGSLSQAAANIARMKGG